MTLDRRGHCPECPPCFGSHGSEHCPACPKAGSRRVGELDRVLSIIDAHIPSLTDEDEIEIEGYRYIRGESDAADLAIRTCSCGQRIDGFYEYVDHLKGVLRGS